MDDLLHAAVEEARRVRGTVMLVVEGQAQLWCAACGAVDGSVQLRIGEPRRGWKRWRRSDGEVWLEEHGFIHIIDAWTLPVSSATGDWACAGLLADALSNALGVGRDVQLQRELVHPGALVHELAPDGAPHEEHIAAALRSLVIAGGNARASFDGGQDLWAWAWVIDDHLLIEYEAPRDEREEDTWKVPLTREDAESAAHELVRRIQAERPDAADQPLLIGLMGF